MIQFLLCFFLGHKRVVKNFTGKTYDAGSHPLTGAPQTGHYYTLTKLKFCARCGKELE